VPHYRFYEEFSWRDGCAQTNILELKQLLKEMEPTIFGDIDIQMLEVWRCIALKASDI